MKALRSFYGRLSAIFLVLLLTAGSLHLWVTLDSYRQFERESNQSLNRSLAADLAERFRPFLADSLNYSAIEHTFHELMVMNPFVEIYLLDDEGQLLAYFAEPEKIRRMAVDPEPVRRFVESGGEVPFPLYGDDPRSATASKPFSAAPVTIGGERPGYLYVILGGEQYESSTAMVRGSYIVRATATGATLLFGATVVIGLLSFFLLTRRLRGVTAVVRRFREGDWGGRAEAGDSDEVGELAAAFNEMADTIAASVEKLEQTDRLRRELVAGVSHDLRSPLTSIRGYVETILIKESDLSPEQRRRYLETVSQNIDFLSKLVDDLFELSKLEAGQSQPRLEPFSVQELAHDVVMKYQPRAEARDLRLAAPPPQSLPLVRADISMIERTLDNLIENALRHTPAQGEVRVELGHDEEKGSVLVTVSDTGTGIGPSDLPHIFDRFYRVSGGAAGGAGLGLAISQKIIEAHQSHIEVDSAVGRGTVFSFALAADAGSRHM